MPGVQLVGMMTSCFLRVLGMSKSLILWPHELSSIDELNVSLILIYSPGGFVHEACGLPIQSMSSIARLLSRLIHLLPGLY